MDHWGVFSPNETDRRTINQNIRRNNHETLLKKGRRRQILKHRRERDENLKV